jgi:hypothetical protein
MRRLFVFDHIRCVAGLDDRSQLSRLKVTEESREAVFSHARPGIKGVYDSHYYFDEKREALELWVARLRSIVKPPPSNILPLRKTISCFEIKWRRRPGLEISCPQAAKPGVSA